MDRNLYLYPLYQGCRNSLFWVPVFFLYFSSRLPLDQVLQLEAIYYVSVVILEVPSGYFSDRIGRKPTLVLAMSFWTLASLLFAATASFHWFVLAQFLMAAGMAFNSGTDSALLYDSLQAAGRESEIGFHEGRAESIGFFAAAGAGLIGGAMAGFDLRWAYVLTALVSSCALLTALRFREPQHVSRTPEAALAPHRQLAACVGHLRDGVLLWTFVFLAGMTIFNHVPYEFFQPYIGFLLEGRGPAGYSPTPAMAGLHMAGTYFLSALFASRADRFRRLLGVPTVLLGAWLLQGLLILSMAVWLHPAVALLLLLRSAPRALMNPVSRAVMHPRLEKRIRATYLSLLSLVGRLAFSATLWIAAWAASGDPAVSHEVMSRLLSGYLILALVLLLPLAATAPWLARATR